MLFLAHRTPHQIGFAEAVTGQLLGELHDLFLIDEHAKGVAENVFHLGHDVLDLFYAAMTVDKIVDHAAVERAGTIQSVQCR